MRPKIIFLVFITLSLTVESETRTPRRRKKEVLTFEPNSTKNPFDEQWDSPLLHFEEDYHVEEVQIDQDFQLHEGQLNDSSLIANSSKKLEDDWVETKRSRMKSLESMSSWAECEERDTCYSSYELPFAARNCFCDPHCIIYNDCCPDSPALMEGRPVGLPNITSESVTCRKLDNVDSNAEFYVVNRCPSSYRDDYVRKRCEQADVSFQDIFHRVYVSSEKSEILYRNAYCAICHGESKRLKFWQIIRKCRLEDEKILRVDPTLSSFQQLESQVNNSCKLELVPPSYVLPRKCKSHLADCPEGWKGEREEGLCRSGSTSYVYSNTRTFKNKYCALCNGEEESGLTCKDSNSAASQFDFAFSEDAASKPTGLWIVTDLTETLGHIRTPTHFGHPVKLGNCRETGQVFDPFRKLCRRIRCDEEGFKYWAGKCIGKAKTTSIATSAATITTTAANMKSASKKPRVTTKKVSKTSQAITPVVRDTPAIIEVDSWREKVKAITLSTSSTTTTATTAVTTTTKTSASTLAGKFHGISRDVPEQIPNTHRETEIIIKPTSDKKEAIKKMDKNEGEFLKDFVTLTTRSTIDYDDELLFPPSKTPEGIQRLVRKRKTTTLESRIESLPVTTTTTTLKVWMEEKEEFAEKKEKAVEGGNADDEKDEKNQKDIFPSPDKIKVPTMPDHEIADASPSAESPNRFSSPFQRVTSRKHLTSSGQVGGRAAHRSFSCLEWQTIEAYQYLSFENETVFIFSLSRLFQPEDIRHVASGDIHLDTGIIEVCLKRSGVTDKLADREESSPISLNVTALEPMADLVIMFHYDKSLSLTSLFLTVIGIVGLSVSSVGMLAPSLVRKTLVTKCIVCLMFASLVKQCLYLSSSVVSNLDHPEGIDSTKIRTDIISPISRFCFWNGVFLHYFVLACSFWTNAFVVAIVKKEGNLEKMGDSREEEVINLNSNSVKQKSFRNSFLFYNLYAWLSPLAIVFAAFAIDLTAVSWNSTSMRPFYGQYEVCWITGENAIWMFLAFPLLILFVVNLAVLITTGVKTLKNSKSVLSKGSSSPYLRYKIAFGIAHTLLLFLVWTFAFAGGYAHRADHYARVWFIFLVFDFLSAFSLHLVFFSLRFLPSILGRQATFDLQSTDELSPSSSNPDTPAPNFGLKMNGHDNLAAKDKLMSEEVAPQETAM